MMLLNFGWFWFVGGVLGRHVYINCINHDMATVGGNAIIEQSTNQTATQTHTTKSAMSAPESTG